MSDTFEMTNTQFVPINIDVLRRFAYNIDKKKHEDMEMDNLVREKRGEPALIGSISSEGYLNSIIRSGDYEFVESEDYKFIMCEVGIFAPTKKPVIKLGDLYVDFNSYLRTN